MCGRHNKPPGPLRTNSLKKKKKVWFLKNFEDDLVSSNRIRVSSQILAALSLGKDNFRFSFKNTHLNIWNVFFFSAQDKVFRLQDPHHFHSSFFLFTQIRTPNLLEFLFDLFCSRIQTKIAVTQNPHTPFGTKSRVIWVVTMHPASAFVLNTSTPPRVLSMEIAGLLCLLNPTPN